MTSTIDHERMPQSSWHCIVMAGKSELSPRGSSASGSLHSNNIAEAGGEQGTNPHVIVVVVVELWLFVRA